MPKDYKRVLAAARRAEREGRDVNEAVMAAAQRLSGGAEQMADPKGFLTTPRQTACRRPVDVRIQDWREVYTEFRRARAGAPGRALHGLRHPVLP